MRLAMGLTILGAVLLITGLLMVVIGETLRLKSGHGGAGIVGPGEFLAFCGLGIGVALLVVLAVGRVDREPADRAGTVPARAEPARGDGSGRSRRRWAVGAGGRSARRRGSAEEWLGPLRTAGAGIAQRVAPPPPPSWPEPAENRPGADDYVDDGWHPDMDEEWSPGPAYVWSPGDEDGWGSSEDRDWDPGDEGWNIRRGEDWDAGEPAGITAWPPAHLAGQEPGPVPAFSSDRDADYVAGLEAGYLTAGPVPGPAAAPHLADPETEYPGAWGSDDEEAGRTREDDDTSPIPAIRDAGEPVAPPRAGESTGPPRTGEPAQVPGSFSVWEPAPKRGPAQVPESFSVWEPGPKPGPAQVPGSFSVWEPAPKPGQPQGRDSSADEAYQPAHAEPPAAHTQEKIEQIKDLYLTAEAIGEDALGRHFDELRQRQRSLISEFFENAGLGTKDTPPLPGDGPAQDSASLPG
jgi:hypothetical protein